MNYTYRVRYRDMSATIVTVPVSLDIEKMAYDYAEWLLQKETIAEAWVERRPNDWERLPDRKSE